MRSRKAKFQKRNSFNRNAFLRERFSKAVISVRYLSTSNETCMQVLRSIRLMRPEQNKASTPLPLHFINEGFFAVFYWALAASCKKLSDHRVSIFPRNIGLTEDGEFYLFLLNKLPYSSPVPVGVSSRHKQDY